MPCASWKGFLRLSLVSCPVYLSPATTRTKAIRLHQVRVRGPTSEHADIEEQEELSRRRGIGARQQQAEAGPGQTEDVAPAKARQRPRTPVSDLLAGLKRSPQKETGEQPPPQQKRKAAADRRQRNLRLPVEGKGGRRPAETSAGAASRRRKTS